LFERYGRTESCASSLAVACGASTETFKQLQPPATDVEVDEFVQRFFIDYSGRQWAKNVYDAWALPSLDRPNFQAEQRILHSIFLGLLDRSERLRAQIVAEVLNVSGFARHHSGVPVEKLLSILEQSVKLGAFPQITLFHKSHY